MFRHRAATLSGAPRSPKRGAPAWLAATAFVALSLSPGCAARGAGARATLVADAAAEQELMAADRAFAAATAARGVEGWTSFFAADGAQLADGKSLVVGKESLRALMGPLLARADRQLVWEPERASVARSGDPGYTFGHARFVAIEGAPRRSSARLRYLTVCKRQPEGARRVAMEVGNDEP